MKLMLLGLSLLISTSVLAQAVPVDQELTFYASLTCFSNAKLTGLASNPDDQSKLLEAKKNTTHFWEVIAIPAIDAAAKLLDQGKAAAEDPANQKVISDGYEPCALYASIVSLIERYKSAGNTCVDANDKIVDFTALESSCTKLIDSINKIYPQ